MSHSTKSRRRPPRKEGRPSVYDPVEHPRVAREQTANGKTLADLAELFSVARSTVQEWQQNHAEFSVAIKLGREDSADRVERALFERAIGYSCPDEKLLVVSGGQGMGSSVERHETVTHYPPETAAASLFLRNRRPKEWKDKQVVEIHGSDALARRLAAAKERKKKPQGDA